MTVKKRIAITGAGGQLGFHCVMKLGRHYGYDVVAIDRDGLNDSQRLVDAVTGVDVVLHLAGINRGGDAEISDGNTKLAEVLCQALEQCNSSAHVLYGSSTQIDKDNVYGKSKRDAGFILQKQCQKTGSGFTNLILPNLFGEFSRPHYNNFTGTFCDQIVSGKALSINDPASPVELLHYGEVADLIHSCIVDGQFGNVSPKGHLTTVGAVAEKLQSFYATYSNGVFPDVRAPFDLKLFNMLRGYMFENQFPFSLTRHADARGSFFECIRAENSGQTAFSTTVPGITRGDHFHFEKVERFLVLSGSACISVRRLIDNKRWDFHVSSDKPVFVDMPTLHTHNITNTGSGELLTLFWTHDFFDPAHPDTYLEQV